MAAWRRLSTAAAALLVLLLVVIVLAAGTDALVLKGALFSVWVLDTVDRDEGAWEAWAATHVWT